MQNTSETKPSATPSKKYGFDLSVLQVGDVLFSCDDTPASKVIRRATKGKYSHAMLYVGHSMIHAMPDGVYSKNPQRYLRDQEDQLSAYRIIPEHQDENLIEQVCDNARYHIGALYSVPAAALSKAISRTGLINSFSPGKQFCSRLVAQAFNDAGVQLVEHVDFCSPHDLASSIKLVRVDGAVREMSQREIEFAESEDFNLFLQKINFQWLDKTRSLAQRKNLGEIRNMNDVLPMLVNNPGYDRVVSNYIISSKYPDFYDWDRKKNKYRYDADEFMRKAASDDELIHLIYGELESLNSDYSRHGKNLEAARNNFSHFGYLQYMQIEFELANNLFDETVCRLNTLKAVAEKLGISLVRE